MTDAEGLLREDWVRRMNQLGGEDTPFYFILDFNLKAPLVLTTEEAAKAGIQFSFQKNKTNVPQEAPHAIALHKQPIPFSEYKTGFDRVMHAIHAGDTYLLNLTCTTPIEGISSLANVFASAHAPYKMLWPEKFTVFSPEQFVSVVDGVIRTFPMKGTIDASLPYAKEKLLADVKEQEEHATVVDLLRNDLSIVADKVTVERYRFISTITTPTQTLLQCSSEITGQLPRDYFSKLGDIMKALLPAGSVTGAPKKRTVELIKSIEAEPRGYYTGVFGYFDGKILDSAVMIRMIEQRGNEFYYRSGGGITYQSQAESEYQEMTDKIYVPVS